MAAPHSCPLGVLSEEFSWLRATRLPRHPLQTILRGANRGGAFQKITSRSEIFLEVSFVAENTHFGVLPRIESFWIDDPAFILPPLLQHVHSGRQRSRKLIKWEIAHAPSGPRAN